MLDRISYSTFKDWHNCPRYFKIVHIDKLYKFLGNIHTTFGTGMHKVCEGKLSQEEQDWNKLLEEKFLKEILQLPEEESQKITEESLAEFLDQGKKIIPEIIPTLKDYFGEFSVVAVEWQFMQDIDFIENCKLKFKGFIDAILKTADGKYHIIDFKTTSWGWDPRHKGDKITTYQLTLYKYFFCKAKNINPEDVETHFVLLKRTAKEGKKVEPFRVTSGPKKMDNAIQAVKQVISSIQKDFFPKNKTKCKDCVCKDKMCL